ncbi:MAG TPA: biopolymer transporter ExbD [Nevskiaceae bacterium]|nr:biopolymer transporter ExbD [Nevskiaceae bacterium]
MSSSKFTANRRLKRRLRKEAKGGIVILNLVSMIDMFTALVFFLLIITSSVVTMRNPKSLTLPNSVSTQPPGEAPVLMITDSEILLQGAPVMSVAQAMQTNGEILAPLQARLQAVPLDQGTTAPTAKAPTGTRRPSAPSRGKVNIMADKSTPYALLKKVMTTCGAVRFTDISLSVNHIPSHQP